MDVTEAKQLKHGSQIPKIKYINQNFTRQRHRFMGYTLLSEFKTENIIMHNSQFLSGCYN
jgi:hypothetical protein